MTSIVTEIATPTQIINNPNAGVQGPPGPDSAADLLEIWTTLSDIYTVNLAASDVTVSAGNSTRSMYLLTGAPSARVVTFTPSDHTPSFFSIINNTGFEVDIAFSTGEACLNTSFIEAGGYINVMFAPGVSWISQRLQMTDFATQFNYAQAFTSHGAYNLQVGAQNAADAKVADNLTASTTVAPSKTAVNTALALKINSSLLGQANGVSTLGADSKVPINQIPDAILGTLKFKGMWNATTNIVTSADAALNGNAIPAASTSNEGYYFIVSVGGSTSEGGITDWVVGDWLLSYGTAWTKIDNTDAVVSVNGMVGPVTISTITGNAGTATALATARNIDGQSFDGSANITVVAPATVAATSKSTPVDADVIPIADSADSNTLKKLTWTNLKAALKSYLDGFYLQPSPATTLSMASVDVTLSSTQALIAVLNLTNTGDGTKTVTYTASASMLGIYTIRNEGTSAVHITSGETYSASVPAGETIDLIYVYGTGFLYRTKMRTISRSFSSGTTNGALTTEQMMISLPLPKNTLQQDGDSCIAQIALDKSGTASTQMIRLRVGTAGTNADIAIWAVNALAGTNDAVYTEVKFTRVNATTIMLTSIPGWYVPFNTTASNYVTYTVPDLNTTNSLVTISADYSSGGGTETVSSYRFALRVE